MHTACTDQIRVSSTSVASDVCHFFVLGTFKLLRPGAESHRGPGQEDHKFEVGLSIFMEP